LVGYLLRHYVKRKLKGLGYTFEQFDLESFVRCVEKQRGRRIDFIATDFPTGYDGAWITAKDELVEYICFDQALSPLHQDHVKLHELGHIICGHETLSLSQGEMAQLLANGGDLSAVLCRANDLKPNRQEREAEMVATVIQTWANARTGLGTSPSSSPAGTSYLSIFCDRD
jgi:hypothetical protein